ncbi:MAG TPA: tripartite tricarboxylate transporter substrate-binding protein, partial [bacterium]|nr:tripartite tricarboxylate transporter substrate-binding protein [bacterium]
MLLKRNWMKTLPSILVVTMLVGVGILAGCSQEVEEGFPSKPVVLLVPFGPGGGMDTISRALSSCAKDYLGQSIEVRNVPGGTGTIAGLQLKDADPDGYTLEIVSHGTHASTPAYSDVDYDPLTDFDYIIQLQNPNQMLSVHEDSPFTTVDDLVV